MNEVIIIDMVGVLKYAKKISPETIAALGELIAQCSNEISINEIDIDE